MFSFIESKLFTALVEDDLTDEEYQALQALLIEQPEAGKVIRGSGGLRKLRWRAPGRGKRSGYRVIYYVAEQDVIWMLTIYPKNVHDDIPKDVLRKIRKEIDNA